MSDIVLTNTFVAMECGQCGVPFALTQSFYSRRRNDHKTWYCPNGCNRYYPAKSDIEVERQKARRARQDAAWWEERARQEEGKAKRAEASRRVIKGHLTRTKRRVAAGICPCCKRSFKDLARHMSGQHPEYAE